MRILKLVKLKQFDLIANDCCINTFYKKYEFPCRPVLFDVLY